jgi:hypothetical protein
VNPTVPTTVPVTQHPVAVFRTRQEPVHVPFGYPIGTVIDPANTRVEQAPLPVPQTIVGRATPPMIARPANLLAISEWLSVMAWPFRLLKVPSAMRVPIAPHQGMTPFAERVNIDMPPQTSLGGMTSIKAPTYTGAQYGKLGVFT